MKTSRTNHSRNCGSVLLVALLLTAVVGMILFSYLQLIQARTKVRARSLAWNSAIPVLEGGIEEAFTHLEDDPIMSANGWTATTINAAIVYQKSRTNSDNTYYLVTLSNVTTTPIISPVIYSQGFVPAPLGQGYISRLVQVITTNPITFSKAVAAKGFVDLAGQSTVDSFDSSNTNYSTGGRYDPAKRRANGGVVTNSRGTPAIDVSNGHIYGPVDTGPGGTVTTAGGGTVGDLSWSSNYTGIEPGYTNNDMNVSYPDQVPPAGAQLWLPVITTAAQGIVSTNTYILANGNYAAVSGLNMNSHDTMLVTGNCSLYIGGDFSMGSGCAIYIAPGATLSLYMDGGTTTLSGNGIVNQTGVASSFSYYGTTNNTTIKYTGQADFIGTINAPEADFTISGGANVCGAAIVNTYTSKSAGAALHFDESLSNRGLFKLVSYREL